MKKRLLATVTAVAIGLTVSATSIASADDRKGMEKFSSILSSLVSNGTITQSQADAITKAAQAAAEVAKGAMKENRAKLDSIITSTLGISLESLKTRLKAGESLAAIAGGCMLVHTVVGIAVVLVTRVGLSGCCAKCVSLMLTVTCL